MFTVMQSLNREASMVILAEIWDKQATKQVLVDNPRQIGITTISLNVTTME